MGGNPEQGTHGFYGIPGNAVDRNGSSRIDYFGIRNTFRCSLHKNRQQHDG